MFTLDGRRLLICGVFVARGKISHFGALVGIISMHFGSFLRAPNTHLDLKQKFLLASSQLNQQLLLLGRQI